MKHVVAVPVFPGSNCEHETVSWINQNLEAEAQIFDATGLSQLVTSKLAAVIIPGGFSYGDYLRAGAIAARSLEMKHIKNFAKEGVPILGICNGFQILCEAGLLPGVLIRNLTKKHHHFPVRLSIEREYLQKLGPNIAWLPHSPEGFSQTAFGFFSDFVLPQSCGMGCYIPTPSSQISATPVLPLLKYLDNENGSTDAVAGVTNVTGNILGMMPHPERASDMLSGGASGLIFLLGLSISQKIAIKENSPLSTFANSFFSNMGVK